MMDPLLDFMHCTGTQLPLQLLEDPPVPRLDCLVDRLLRVLRSTVEGGNSQAEWTHWYSGADAKLHCCRVHCLVPHTAAVYIY
jgi:hypothetical protein